MRLSKPNYWDHGSFSIWPYIVFPISLIIKLINFVKKRIVKKKYYPIPIICVGNIYIGGTGKTPLCIELFSILKNLKKNPAFIKKKYFSHQDEVKLLNKEGPLFENKKRSLAIENAIKNKANVVILDDGFQDFSINKNLSILCFNSKQLVGNGFTIPSGPLREELKEIKRADCVVINGQKNKEFENKLKLHNEAIKIFYSNYIPVNKNDFTNKNIIAFAGIGNGNNFFDLCKENNLNIIKKITFPDHYFYTQKNIDILTETAKKNQAILLTTEKDYVRLSEIQRKNIFCLKIKIEIENKENLIKELNKII